MASVLVSHKMTDFSNLPISTEARLALECGSDADLYWRELYHNLPEHSNQFRYYHWKEATKFFKTSQHTWNLNAPVTTGLIPLIIYNIQERFWSDPALIQARGSQPLPSMSPSSQTPTDSGQTGLPLSLPRPIPW